MLHAIDRRASARDGRALHGGRFSYVLRILIIEDDEQVRRFLKRVLSREGYRVTAVATGRHALQVLRETATDVVLVDMSIPDIDGPCLVRQIASEFLFVKAIALSGEMTAPMRSLAIRSGAAATAPKPITCRELCSVIRSVSDVP